MLRKISIILIVAVLMPSAVLAFLAVRSLKDQQIVLERQQGLLYQEVVDGVALRIDSYIQNLQTKFSDEVDEMLTGQGGGIPPEHFNRALRLRWPMAKVGFVVDHQGVLLSPRAGSNNVEQKFVEENRLFFSNTVEEEVYNQDRGMRGGINAMAKGKAKEKPSGKASLFVSFEKHRDGTVRFRGAVVGKPESSTGKGMAKPQSASASVPGEDATDKQVASRRMAGATELQTESLEEQRQEIALSSQELDDDIPVLEERLSRVGMTSQPLPEQAKSDLLMEADSPEQSAELSDSVSVFANEPPALASADGFKLMDEETLEEAAEEPAEEGKASTYARPSSSPLASVAMKSRPPRHVQPTVEKPAPQPAAAPQSKKLKNESTPLKQIESYENIDALNKANMSQRLVNPTQRFDDQSALLSKVQPEYAAFQSLVGDERQGAYARFLQDHLAIFFWYRPAGSDGKIFGVELSMPVLRDKVGELLDETEDRTRYQVPVALAILDDKAQPVGVVPPSFSADWRRPFVATELGERIEILPHWEVAAYLVHPRQLQEAATNLRWSLGSIIGLMLLAVALGGIVLWRDFRRELVSARQKTDFVSNVSHELKTPLTSIRMFSELLRRQSEKPLPEGTEENQQRYLDIIIAEASRLTRLINNILDFSRMEQSRKQYRMAEMDLAELTREIAVAYRAHLEQSGYKLEVSKDDVKLPVQADRDAMTQVLLNLISNAEKYGGDAKHIRIELDLDQANGLALVRVLDRGPGVPRGHETQIFKKFYRAHDSLSSGIQGSGLGLTLALSIAQSHGGMLRYSRRPGGGACFTLSLPVSDEEPEKTTS